MVHYWHIHGHISRCGVCWLIFPSTKRGGIFFHVGQLLSRRFVFITASYFFMGANSGSRGDLLPSLRLYHRLAPISIPFHPDFANGGIFWRGAFAQFIQTIRFHIVYPPPGYFWACGWGFLLPAIFGHRQPMGVDYSAHGEQHWIKLFASGGGF